MAAIHSRLLHRRPYATANASAVLRSTRALVLTSCDTVQLHLKSICKTQPVPEGLCLAVMWLACPRLVLHCQGVGRDQRPCLPLALTWSCFAGLTAPSLSHHHQRPLPCHTLNQLPLTAGHTSELAPSVPQCYKASSFTTDLPKDIIFSSAIAANSWIEGMLHSAFAAA